MRRPSTSPALLLGLLAVATIYATAALADVVVLKSGGRFTGTITSEDPELVSIRSEGSTWSFKREKIASVEKEAAGRAENAAYERSRAPKRRTASHGRHVEEVASNDSPSAGVVIYGTSWCGYCKKARAFFASRNIPYVDKDVERDPGANAEIQRKCAAVGRTFGGGVPVLDVYGRIIDGFDTAAIEQAIRAYRG